MMTEIPQCPTPCDDDCEQLCHEAHRVTSRQDHDPEQCRAAAVAAARAWLETVPVVCGAGIPPAPPAPVDAISVHSALQYAAHLSDGTVVTVTRLCEAGPDGPDVVLPAEHPFPGGERP